MSKRRRIIVRTVVSTLMTVAVLLLSTALLFAMLGYRFNKDEGTFTQGGLVQFITTPPGAQVTVGSAKLANITPSKITLTPGTYPVNIERADYHQWSKTVTIEAGTITWLNSARLVPKKLETVAVAQHASAASVQFSPKAQYVAIIEDAGKPTIILDSLDQEKLEKTDIMSLPQSTYSAGEAHIFGLDSWSDNERYLLVRHTFDAKSEWLVVDTEDVTKTRILPSFAEASPTQVAFDKRSANNIIALYSDGTIRNIDVETEEVVVYPLANLASFSFITDQSISYVTKPVNGTVSVGYYTLDAKSMRSLKSIRTNEPVYAAGGRYFTNHNIYVSHRNEIYIYSAETLPRSDSQDRWNPMPTKTLTTTEPVSSLKSKTNGRFILATHGISQSVYDFERTQYSTTALSRQAQPLTGPVKWFDDYNFWSTNGGVLRMYEYDGTNQHDLVNVQPGTPAIISTNNEYLYTIAPFDTGVRVQATKMILD